MDRVVTTLSGLVILSVFITASANVFELGNMIKCVDHLDSLITAYSKYNGYGCYCGLGGGGDAVDDIDRCCQAHDECYDALTNCENFLGTLYKYTSHCPTNHGGGSASPSLHPMITCAHIKEQGDEERCGHELCECDRKLSECFFKNRESYNEDYQTHDRKTCGTNP